MLLRYGFSRRGLPAMFVAALCVCNLPADEALAGPLAALRQPQQAGANNAPTPRPLQLAERTDRSKEPAAPTMDGGQGAEHPLMPALRWAYSGVGNVEKLNDYSAKLVKRERIGDQLGEFEYMFVKVRHRPFSVYMCFLSPAAVKGQEVIFIEGQNNGNMWAHTVGVRDRLIGTVSIKPDGVVAMHNQRYPLTELGILNMVRRLIQVGEQDMKYGECEVKFFKGAKINNRICTCIQVVHPQARRNFLFHLARIFVDDELNLPIRYESYGWPKQPGGVPELLEEYTYLDLKLNNGFTDADFDIRNASYQFRESAH